MIETWRQAVNGAAFQNAAGTTYFLMGPLRGGGYL
jgi:hypothetical protein